MLAESKARKSTAVFRRMSKYLPSTGQWYYGQVVRNKSLGVKSPIAHIEALFGLYSRRDENNGGFTFSCPNNSRTTQPHDCSAVINEHTSEIFLQREQQMRQEANIINNDVRGAAWGGRNMLCVNSCRELAMVSYVNGQSAGVLSYCFGQVLVVVASFVLGSQTFVMDLKKEEEKAQEEEDEDSEKEEEDDDEKEEEDDDDGEKEEEEEDDDEKEEEKKNNKKKKKERAKRDRRKEGRRGGGQWEERESVEEKGNEGKRI
ncbi:family with sequence similarity 181, member b [Plakobranchus ocellatus]|uniref:Family with sequence similarity 181, member b n=1 Tax=Plakobranchus ocellatus TaxID=259542 RepID=A0AAV3YN29_9GAST|nr:family with sequence similarity 181, member b [Plakobranchus ocellatus]